MSVYILFQYRLLDMVKKGFPRDMAKRENSESIAWHAVVNFDVLVLKAPVDF